MSVMQSEKDFFYHYNVIVHNHDFEKVFKKIADALLEFHVLDNKICLYIVAVNKVLLLVFSFVEI